MNGRRTLAVMGLALLVQDAAADAKVNEEQGFQLGQVAVSLGLGLLNGQAQEKAYNPYNGKKISQLNWEIKQIPTLHLGLTYDPLEWLSIEARGWTQIAKGNGHMKDYDWLGGDGEGWSDYSDHPDTRVQKAWQAELAATAWALKRDDLAVGVMLGYQRTQLGWQARGGRFVYSEDDFRESTGEFPRGEKAASYQQTYDTPYIGLVGIYNYRAWTLEGRFKYSQWVKARDFDTHHMRSVTFAGNHGNTGQMQSLALGASYQLSPQLAVKAGVDYQVYTEAKGSTRYTELDSGQSYHFGGKAGSQASRTVLSSLALDYRF